MPRRCGASNFHNGSPTWRTRGQRKRRGHEKQSRKDLKDNKEKR